MLVVITGPVRSGKSARALQVALAFGLPLTYVATARVDSADLEMRARIAHHRSHRAVDAVVELWAPGGPDLAAIVTAAAAGTTLLVDSVGTWIAGYMLDLETLSECDAVAAAEQLASMCEPLIAALAAARAHVVIVAEETGWGLVPVSAQGRIFRDQMGRFVQRVARDAARVELVVAGYALNLKAVGVAIE